MGEKRIYVWFEAVQGYLSCAKIWSRNHGGGDEWQLWWNQNETSKSKQYVLEKDNIPFHTIIWPSIILGLNMADSNKSSPTLPANGELNLPTVPPVSEVRRFQIQNMPSSSSLKGTTQTPCDIIFFNQHARKSRYRF